MVRKERKDSFLKEGVRLYHCQRAGVGQCDLMQVDVW